MTLIFPIAVAVLEFCASVVYAYHGDWRQAGVWFFYSLAAGFLATL